MITRRIGQFELLCYPFLLHPDLNVDFGDKLSDPTVLFRGKKKQESELDKDECIQNHSFYWMVRAKFCKCN